MREILFRGKDIETKKWVYGFYFVLEAPPVAIASDNKLDSKPKSFIVQNTTPDRGFYRKPFYIEVIPETVGQYTGVKDVKGNKIFEGDVVESMMHCIKVIANIDFECTMHSFTLIAAEGDEFTLIGNIHDNPELLEEVK